MFAAHGPGAGLGAPTCHGPFRRQSPTSIFNMGTPDSCLLCSWQWHSSSRACSCSCITGGNTHTRTQPPARRSGKAVRRSAIFNPRTSEISGPATTRCGYCSFSRFPSDVGCGQNVTLEDASDPPAVGSCELVVSFALQARMRARTETGIQKDESTYLGTCACTHGMGVSRLDELAASADSVAHCRFKCCSYSQVSGETHRFLRVSWHESNE